MAVASQDLYSKSIEVLNENLTNLGISIDTKRTKGSFVYLDCDEDRNDTRSKIEMELENVKFFSKKGMLTKQFLLKYKI